MTAVAAVASPPDRPLVLELAGIRKSYAVGTPAETEVLHGLDLRVAAGEFVALIGPSGSGKSTLLNLIGLLDRPTAGRLMVQGADTGTLDDAGLTRLRGRSLGFVFQHHYLISAFTAAENVQMPLLLERGRPDRVMRATAVRLLTQVGLEKYVDSLPGNMSGGQQQRVAIARALAQDPPLILADEPTGNLDTHTADEVFALMRKIGQERGTAFLFVTHNDALAERCDRVVELVDGHIVADRHQTQR